MENKLLLKLLAQEKKGLGAPGSSHVAKERRNARRSKAHIGLVEPAHSQPGSGGSNVEAKHEGLKDHLFGEQMPMAHFMDNLCLPEQDHRPTCSTWRLWLESMASAMLTDLLVPEPGGPPANQPKPKAKAAQST